MSNIPKAWGVRGSGADGRHGQEYATYIRNFVKENEVAVIGWTDKFSDLTPLENEDQLKSSFQSVYGTDHQEGGASGFELLKIFRFEIKLGDVIVMPWKPKPKKPADIFSVGVVTREYYYESSVSGGLDKEMHHRIGVKWNEEDFPREIFDGESVDSKSLYKHLSRQPTVFLIGGEKSHHACSRRLQEIMGTGSDPGSKWDSISRSQGGIPYRETTPQKIVGKREVWEVDPDLKDRGTEAHRNVQNELAKAVRSAGLEPRSAKRPSPDPEFDVAWQQGDKAFVAEVKSLTEDNEVRQLRLGLGQVLNYAHLLDWSEAKTVQPVLAVERPPAAEYWTALCKEHGVILTWPKKFGELFD